MNRILETENQIQENHRLLSVEVATHCNLGCLHCFVRAEGKPNRSLPIDLVGAIIAEGYQNGYRHLHITGGEPFMFDHLFEAIDIAFLNGFKSVLINSNGTLLSEKLCQRLAEYEGVSITVSLDGPETIHDHLRGKEAHRQTLKGIEKALKANLDLVIFTTIFKKNIRALSKFANELYLRFPEIKYISLIPLLDVKDDGYALSKELLDPDDFIHLVLLITYLNALGLKIEILNMPFYFVVAKLLKIPGIQYAKSLQQEYSLIITADMTIRPSHFSKICVGFYEPGMIRKVLTSQKWINFCSEKKRSCFSCEFFSFCNDKGGVEPFDYDNKSYGKEVYCKRILKHIVR